MSWKPAVKVAGESDKWSYNSVRFETKEEAEMSARDLMSRWMLVIDCAAHESDDPVNYKIDLEEGVMIRVETKDCV